MPRTTPRTPRRKEGVRVRVGEEEGVGEAQMREVTWGRGEAKGRMERR